MCIVLMSVEYDNVLPSLVCYFLAVNSRNQQGMYNYVGLKYEFAIRKPDSGSNLCTLCIVISPLPQLLNVQLSRESIRFKLHQ